MNTIDHRQAVDGFIDSYDPLQDESLKRTIEPKGPDALGDALEEALNADLGGASSEISGVFERRPLVMSDGRRGSTVPSADH